MNGAGDENLLRLLGAGVQRSAPVQGARPPEGPVESAGFAELLAKAKSGAIHSGLPVEIDAGAGVALTGEQAARLERAADRAEAAGIQRALVFLDGMALVLDVKTRTVVGTA